MPPPGVDESNDAGARAHPDDARARCHEPVHAARNLMIGAIGSNAIEAMTASIGLRKNTGSVRGNPEDAIAGIVTLAHDPDVVRAIRGAPHPRATIGAFTAHPVARPGLSRDASAGDGEA